MTDKLEETAADIEALLVSSIADLFDEVIVPNYGKTTSDGVALGPTWWSQKLEAQGIVIKPHAMSERIRRRRSKADSEATRAEPNARADRAIRTIRNQPELVDELVKDPQIRRAVTRGLDEHHARQAADRANRTERKTTQDPTARQIDSAEAINDLGTAAERFSREGNEALRRVGELPESERFWLTGAIDRAEQTLHAARRYLDTGVSEIDAELAEIVNGGS